MLPLCFDENLSNKQYAEDFTSFKMETDDFMHVKLDSEDFDNQFLTQVGFTNPSDLLKELSEPNIEKTFIEFVEGLCTLENFGVDLNLGSLLNTPPSSPDHEPENFHPEIEETLEFPELPHVEPLDMCGDESVWGWDFTPSFTEAVSNPVMIDDAWMGPSTSHLNTQNTKILPQISPSPSVKNTYALLTRKRNSESCSSSDSNDSELSEVSSGVLLPTFSAVSPTPSSDIVELQSPSNARTSNCNAKVLEISSYRGALSDHSYHDVRGSRKNDRLGVQTPSDSEEDEEVDVVAVPVKRSNLPQMPSSQAQRQIQQQMAVVAASKSVSARPGPCRTQVMSKQGVRRATSPTESAFVSLKIGGLYGGRPTNRHENSNSNNRRKGKNLRGLSNVSADRREDHNSNERERRSDLKNLYLQLNTLLPKEDVGSKPRSKANILLGAIGQAEMLREIEKTRVNTKKALEAKRRKLLQLVELNQKSLRKHHSITPVVSWTPPHRW